MARRVGRTVVVAAACAAVLAAGTVVATSAGRGPQQEPPARIWVADPAPPPGVPVATVPDVRTEPAGAVVEDWDPTWFWYGVTNEDMRTGVQLLHRMSVVDRVRLVVRGSVIRSQAATYAPTDGTVPADGTVWRAWDRAGDR